MDWHHYYHLSTIYDWMELVSQQHDFISIFEVGKTFEGNSIKGLKISKNPQNTEILVEAGIHPNEIIGPATATFIIDRLINSNGIF
jgi:murein tripeptide amidase MpaA